MPLDFYQVDAFTQQPFSGNPAVVYRLDAALDEALMQRIAAEHNQAETAFVQRQGHAWNIRWFTPEAEVPLCGHATLASAYVLFEVYGEPVQTLNFTCLSGELRVERAHDKLVLDFPLREPEPVQGATALRSEVEAALGAPVQELLALYELGQIQELLAIVSEEQALRALQPNFAALAKLPGLGLIVSAQGQQHDFVSRYFAPAIGIDEDPVTGSTHCVLTPYWAQRLGKKQLNAYQCSSRGGELECELAGPRVRIAGHAVLVAQGQLLLG